jgi:Bacterial Ig-like domain (group 1)
MQSRATLRRRFSLLTLLLVSSIFLAAAPQAMAGETITNGVVKLGVNDLGQLNFSDPDTGEFTGVTYVPTGNDGTRAGCPCEGWGAGAGDGSGNPVFQGRANNFSGIDGVSLVSFTSNPAMTEATSIVDVLNGATPALRVTHHFFPSPTTPNLYQIDITLKNLTGAPLMETRYERIMDWDIEPTPFSEFVTINRGSPAPTNLFYSDDNGFSDNYPFTFAAEGDGPLDPSTVNTSYVDKGPDDHGARFTFDFGTLAAGEEKTFILFYGAAGNEPDANTAVSAAALEMFSYGQPSSSDPSVGTPNTFIWGFRAVGGTPVIPPTLTLTPETATNPVGSSHTVTAHLETSTGDPVPGAKIRFIVTGANPTSGTAFTNASGDAEFTYTGANPGDDKIVACFDSNANDDCDRGEPADEASKKWEGRARDRRWMAGEGRLINGTKKLDYAYIIECNDVTMPKFKGKLLNGTTQTLNVTDIIDVTCSDDPTKTPAKPGVTFDTMEGEGQGTLGSTPVDVLFAFQDGGGPPDANDSAHIRIVRRSDGLLLFDATASPIPPYGGGTRPGRNTANEPPSPL